MLFLLLLNTYPSRINSINNSGSLICIANDKNGVVFLEIDTTLGELP